MIWRLGHRTGWKLAVAESRLSTWIHDSCRSLQCEQREHSFLDKRSEMWSSLHLCWHPLSCDFPALHWTPTRDQSGRAVWYSIDMTIRTVVHCFSLEAQSVNQFSVPRSQHLTETHRRPRAFFCSLSPDCLHTKINTSGILHHFGCLCAAILSAGQVLFVSWTRKEFQCYRDAIFCRKCWCVCWKPEV